MYANVHGIDLQVKLSRIPDSDAFGLYLWWRGPGDKITILCPDGLLRIEEPTGKLEPTIVLSMIDQDAFVEKLRDATNKWFHNKDALIAEERIESLRAGKRRLDADLTRERKLVDWFMKHVESH